MSSFLTQPGLLFTKAMNKLWIQQVISWQPSGIVYGFFTSFPSELMIFLNTSVVFGTVNINKLFLLIKTAHLPCILQLRSPFEGVLMLPPVNWFISQVCCLQKLGISYGFGYFIF